MHVRLDGHEPRHVVFSVSNAGQIPDDLLPHIFDPFRGRDEPSARGEGLGIGLFIVRQIVSAHAAARSRRSRARPGTPPSSCACRARHTRQRRCRTRPDMTGRSKTKPGRILVVEDDWDILEVLKLMLEYEGHQVYHRQARPGRARPPAARPFDLRV